MAKEIIGVIGSGSMGSGIAQVAATFGHEVFVFDTKKEVLEKAKSGIAQGFLKLVEKGKFSADDAQKIQGRMHWVDNLSAFKDCNLVVEAIIENLEVKKKLFSDLESIVSEKCILATNTSSLSVAAIASACKKSERCVGIHFFNPATLMPLVEIIPAMQTSEKTLQESKRIVDSWSKITVIAKDTPGFIVNRVARPFYGEALRIYEEGIADFATIDWAMKEIGGFKMGPFELMDFIGNDINYKVTETVFESFYYDPRYRPSFTQKRHSEAGWFGRKTGRGYYSYATDAVMPEPTNDKALGEKICNRILVMLMNEAIDALHLQIASKEDIDLAMTKGVNYPKGLIQWANEKGLKNVLQSLSDLQEEYGEDRYRPSVLLKRKVRDNVPM